MRKLPVIDLAVQGWLLAADAALVVWLRLGRLALLDSAAGAEARLMVAEKWEAQMELGWLALSGGLGASPLTASRRAVAHYRRAVAHNRRRLSR